MRGSSGNFFSCVMSMITKCSWSPLNSSTIPHHVHTHARKLNERDALLLCDLFLTPGVHYVVFDSLSRGRRLVDSLARIGSFYQAIAYIAPTARNNLCGINLYEMFRSTREPAYALRRFLLYEFDYDFVWISYTKQQPLNSFSQLFMESAIEFNLDRKIPILFVFKNDL